MNDPKTTKRLVDADEICKDFGICERTLYRWIKHGKFPAPMRVNLRKRVWLKTTYEAFLNDASTNHPDRSNVDANV